MSIRQKTEDILKENPNISISELQILLDENKPESLKTDFHKLKRKPEPKEKTKKKSVQQQVSEYLDKNIEACFDTLKSAFPGIKSNSLSAYKSLWKREQKKELKTEDKPVKNNKLGKPAAKRTGNPAKKKKLDIPVKEKMLDKSAKKNQPDKVAKLIKKTGSNNTELVESLKKTVAAQKKKTIDTMSKTLDLSTPDIDEEELKGMTMSDIKRIAVTFLRSIKDLPAKLRR